jgi:hypothetical protein
MTDNPEVTRTLSNVHLIRKAEEALETAVTRENLSVTDIINRALITYDLIAETISDGSEVTIKRADGVTERLRFEG